MEAKRTSLIELLERVPRDAVLVVEHDQFSSNSHPVGRLCHEAAALIRNAALEEAIKVIEEYRFPVGNSPAGELACEWTRDALEDIRDAILELKENSND